MIKINIQLFCGRGADSRISEKKGSVENFFVRDKSHFAKNNYIIIQ